MLKKSPNLSLYMPINVMLIKKKHGPKSDPKRSIGPYVA